MKNYELTCLITPDLDDASLEVEENKLNEILGISSSEKARKIVLAYPVEKKTGAFLYSKEFASDNPKEIEKKIRQEKNIIRFILINKIKEEESITIKPEEKLEEKKEKKSDMKKIEQELEKVLEE